MKIGNVTGNITMTKQAECLDREKILLVEIEGNYMAVLDRAGAKTGDRVLVVTGHAAGCYSMQTPSDAVAVAVVEN